MLRKQKELSVTVQEAASMTPEDLKGKIVRGVFHETHLPEYTDAYRDAIQHAAQASAG